MDVVSLEEQQRHNDNPLNAAIHNLFNHVREAGFRQLQECRFNNVPPVHRAEHLRHLKQAIIAAT